MNARIYPSLLSDHITVQIMLKCLECARVMVFVFCQSKKSSSHFRKADQ